MTKTELIQMFIWMAGGITGFLIGYDGFSKESEPYFVVSEMVQCKAGICNVVLEMDDIAILVPYDSTKVHIGDTLYITK